MQSVTSAVTRMAEGAEDRTRVFRGAKLALFLGAPTVAMMPVILRDAKPGIPDPDRLDLPGGGREPGESPLDCALRETFEELALRLDPGAVRYGRAYPHVLGGETWFFAASLPRAQASQITLGDEGQSWHLMRAATYLAHPKAIPSFQARLRDYLAFRGTPAA